MSFLELVLLLAIVLFLTLIGGLLRVVLGPTRPDRMLAAQLMGTTGVGVLLLLSQALQRPSLMDVALVCSLLASVTTVAFVRRGFLPRAKGASHHDVD
ncbi:MAG: monovalent cation/H+ antiporter complex subunit F [Planctomycetota bacterium]|nr:monovalent cation/H+ antiporter complex subunit F [Planctomycetota bacterium]